ncbi:RNA-splicing ligase RtcB [Caulifigura coniformis]|uniref:3'-phosphate/5'-hydroxy nucleic acid ligase n=1 Tax=Caulifigura coniformis TaxID=2527983 RepID=A0A517SGW3_9PLAN|nr:RtcB family protein [Caulifigura coniformis]QDT55364.1 RNA-splicing ligase RtcB [Caulifigura coniformis]
MTSPPATLFVRSPGRLSTEVVDSVNRIRTAEDVRYVAVMPDAHLAAEVCVGLVLATNRLIYPAAVGGDIGCGMAAVPIDAEADLLDDDVSAGQLLGDLYREVPSNRHRTRRALPDRLRDFPLSDPRLGRMAEREGCIQLGTLGRGNHFLEFQADEDDRMWVMVHSGSRAMGQVITAHHVRNAEGSSVGIPFFDAEGHAGRAYLSDVGWAREYSATNRLEMLRAVETILADRFSATVDWSRLIHSDHDHVRRETHFGNDYLVHRKGAQSARTDEAGIIPGSMGTATFHVVGRGLPESLRSCSHGAGRRLSRDAARRQIGARQLERELRGIWCDRRRFDVLREEAPSAYHDIEKVMQAQKDLVRVVRRLRPVLSYKGT